MAMNNTHDLGLLLLHALPLDGRMWAKHMDILPSRTFAPNLYELGDDLSQWADHCAALVPTQRFVIVGCSVGGSCALEILRSVPDRVAATVLIGTKARHDPDPDFAAKAIACVQAQGPSAAWHQFWAPLFSGFEKGPAEHIALQQSSEDLVRGLRAFHSRVSREDIVATSKTPIHVVTGDQDTLPGLDYAANLATLNPLCKLWVVENCGHYVPLMQPEKMTYIISQALAGCAETDVSSFNG